MAIHRLNETLKWRREYGIYDVVTAEHVEPEVDIVLLVRNNFILNRGWLGRDRKTNSFGVRCQWYAHSSHSFYHDILSRVS